MIPFIRIRKVKKALDDDSIAYIPSAVCSSERTADQNSLFSRCLSVGRLAIYFDGGYVASILRDHFQKTRIDFLKLSEDLTGNEERLRSYYYYCMPHRSRSPSQEEEERHAAVNRFIEALKRLPRFEVRLGKLVQRPEGFAQKGVDVLMSVDIVRMAWDHQVGTAVVVTGDSDLVPAIQAAKDAGVVTRLIYYPGTVSNEILQTVDETVKIDQDLIDRVKLDYSKRT